MNTREIKDNKRQKFSSILTITESCFIVLLILLVVLMMVQINRLQGTARVINYAGLVRGATQRLVKLEIAQQPNDGLVQYLDEVIADLQYGDGEYKLVVLENMDYQEKLNTLMLNWEELKEQIYETREAGYAEMEMVFLLDESESYFQLADEVVSAAELYSDKIAKRIELLEILSAIDMLFLFGILVGQAFLAVKMRQKNAILAKKAYVDTHTGLRNKNMCEEVLENDSYVTEPTACLVFDINNLKVTNDTMGHSVGDRLIADFAGCLRKVVREGDFAGRCGGDEFFVILYGAKLDTAKSVLARLQEEVAHFNALGQNIPISYAEGWSSSEDFEECTMRKLFDVADRCMYQNKRESKENASR